MTLNLSQNRTPPLPTPPQSQAPVHYVVLITGDRHIHLHSVIFNRIGGINNMRLTFIF